MNRLKRKMEIIAKLIPHANIISGESVSLTSVEAVSSFKRSFERLLMALESTLLLLRSEE